MPFDASKKPLVFFHVPKTGGTSAVAALRPCFRHAVTDGGNLYAASFRQGRGRRSVLFHGHAGHGASWAVPQGAVTATLLRAPESHAASHYLHLLRTPQLPYHDAAVRLGFAGLMAAHWQLLAFQAISLDVAVSHEAIRTPQDLFARLPEIRRFLDGIDVVGHLDDLDGFLAEAARRTGHRAPSLPAPRLNTAAGFAVERQEVDRLRAEYRALAADPFLRRVMQAEADVAAQAAGRARATRQSRALAARSEAAGARAFAWASNARPWLQRMLRPGPAS